MFKRTSKKNAQVTIEFTICLVMIILILYGIVRMVRWAGFSLGDRRIQHDAALEQSVGDSWTRDDQSPLKQVEPDFYTVQKMNLVFNHW